MRGVLAANERKVAQDRNSVFLCARYSLYSFWYGSVDRRPPRVTGFELHAGQLTPKAFFSLYRENWSCTRDVRFPDKVRSRSIHIYTCIYELIYIELPRERVCNRGSIESQAPVGQDVDIIGVLIK